MRASLGEDRGPEPGVEVGEFVIEVGHLDAGAGGGGEQRAQLRGPDVALDALGEEGVRHVADLGEGQPADPATARCRSAITIAACRSGRPSKTRKAGE